MTPEPQVHIEANGPHITEEGKRITLPNGNSVSVWPYVSGAGEPGLHIMWRALRGNAVTDSWVNLSAAAAAATFALLHEFVEPHTSLALASDESTEQGTR